jgi:hypothetical protein
VLIGGMQLRSDAVAIAASGSRSVCPRHAARHFSSASITQDAKQPCMHCRTHSDVLK